MIAQLRGRVLTRQPNLAVIDVGGVGYGVHIPLSTYTRLEGASGEITLLVHTHVTQDAIELFGFSTSVEKQLFTLLITVSGVGPKLAINILSGIAPEELIAAIERKDEARLVMVPGIGKKTAARLALELHDKVRAMAIETKAGEPAGLGLRADLVSALVNLGYPEPRATRAVEEAMRDEVASEFEPLFKKALALLSK